MAEAFSYFKMALRALTGHVLQPVVFWQMEFIRREDCRFC